MMQNNNLCNDQIPEALSFDKISVQYGQAKILHEINFYAKTGEIISIIGPSGAGKSTLLGVVAGMVKPSSGEIYINGNRATSVPAHARKIGIVFQDALLFPHLTVYNNIAYPLRSRLPLHRLVKNLIHTSDTKIDHQVRKMMALVNLSDYGNRKPDELSGGERQRVAIARALITEPSILCLDEPFSALDISLRRSLLHQIVTLNQRLNVTILYVTHDQDEALSIGHRIIIIRNGRIIDNATPPELYKEPPSEFTASFLGLCNIYSIDSISNVDGILHVKTKKGPQFAYQMPISITNPNYVAIRPEKIMMCRYDDCNKISNNDVSLNDTGQIVSKWYYGSRINYSVETDKYKIEIEISSAQNMQEFNCGDIILFSFNQSDVIFLIK